MQPRSVQERVASVVDARAAVAHAVATGVTFDVSGVERGLRAITELRAWLAAGEAELTAALVSAVPFPEQRLAECARTSLSDATKQRERAVSLQTLPSLANALDRGAVTAAHIDAITRACRRLDTDAERAELRRRLDLLVAVARVATLDQWARRINREVAAVRRGDGMDRFERQRRATRARTWIDADGMVCLSARFDPLTGRSIVARLDQAVQATFAERVPDGCPTDPIEKQQFLQGLALARLIEGDLPAARSGRPEYIVVIDTSTDRGDGSPMIDWGLPIEVPDRVHAELLRAADRRGDVHAVVVRNGVVIHAPGQLDLGRSTRLASRAQRRALRAMYATCAIPGCSVAFDRCKLHHVIWWRHGGRTDLDNLLPVCAHHHSRIHDAGWVVTLGPNRALTLTLPDGRIHNTGPPSRRAA